MNAPIRQDAEHAHELDIRGGATVMHKEIFDVFQILSGSISGGRAHFLHSFTDYDEAQQYVGQRGHKDKYAIRRTKTLSGSQTLHFFTVRKKSQGVKRYSGYQTKTIHDTYAEHLFDLDPASLGEIQ